MSAKITINGRFTAARATGVQRVAFNLIKGLDQIGAGSASMTVLTPPGADHKLNLKIIKVREFGRLKGQAWEQVDLPRGAGRSALVNLCNAAPLLRSSAATMIHDAQVFISPSSYSPRFVAWYKFSLPKIAARAERILTVSDFSKQMLANYKVAPAEKIDVIYNGVDHIQNIEANLTALTTLGVEPQAFVVVFGNLQSHKNLRIILEAFRAPALKDLRLVIIGDVNATSILERLGVEAPQRAVFARQAPDEDVRALLENALCLVHPSKTEGFGLPPLEAMTFDCPAIVAPAGALPEICGDGALYADPNDAEAWVDAILQVKDESLRRGLIAKGRLRVAQFTWANSAAHLSQILQTVTG